jgi:hypothetical protein
MTASYHCQCLTEALRAHVIANGDGKSYVEG